MKKSESIKKTLRILFLGIIVFLVGGLGGVFYNQYVFPKIKANEFLSRLDFLSHVSENVTVINKTQQITVKEDDSINELVSQPSTAVVNIISASNQKVLDKTPKVSQLSGSGVIGTSDGIIITYRSAIIEKNATYTVFLYDGSHYDAQLIGIDEFTNLAFLKVDASNLPVVSFANSDDFMPGKKLIAIGNSFGEYQNRYISGLLSNDDRTFNLAGTLSLSDKLEGVFEMDASNLKDFVGGPVIGYGGEVVGINGSIIIDNQIKYFEIPSNIVKQSLNLAIENKLAQQPQFGAYYISITKEYAFAHSMAQDRGALIYSPSGKQGLAMISGSASELSGLRVNDIVLAVGNQEINLDNPLSNVIHRYKKGETVQLKVLRAGEEMTISVTF